MKVFPVAVVEAMKAGVVPLVTNWQGATDELIVPGETGYYLATADAEGYTDKIISLHTNRALLKQLSKTGIEKANALFDPYINTREIENIFHEAANKKQDRKHAKKVYGSRLDQSWLPNFITSICRS